VRVAVAGLAVDAVAADVISAFRQAGIRPILLRGPALARLLYDDRVRAYGDIDLLVSLDDVAKAEGVLSELGFTPSPNIVHFQRDHAATWRRADRVDVDLHHTLVGVGGSPSDVWSALSSRIESMAVGGIEVEVLSPAASAMQIALHAAQHGVEVQRPMRDLERALTRLPDETWDTAASLARTLDATAAFATGLRLLPPGERIAARLGLPQEQSAEIALRARTPPPVSRGIMRLGKTRGLRAKTKLLARELVPERVFLRRQSALARRGRVGLAAAYVYRPFWLLWHVVPAVRAWRRAQREAGERPVEGRDA
jgi:putative nucleotidyltransferase-like protein